MRREADEKAAETNPGGKIPGERQEIPGVSLSQTQTKVGGVEQEGGNLSPGKPADTSIIPYPASRVNKNLLRMRSPGTQSAGPDRGWQFLGNLNILYAFVPRVTRQRVCNEGCAFPG